MTQNERVLEHLKRYGSINAGEALRLYSVERLASRISELRKMGTVITRQYETVKNQFGDKVRVVRYYAGGD